MASPFAFPLEAAGLAEAAGDAELLLVLLAFEEAALAEADGFGVDGVDVADALAEALALGAADALALGEADMPTEADGEADAPAAVVVVDEP